MRFIKAIDASGDTKDANYQAKFVLDCMDESGGSHLYTVLFFDGACKASFPIIEAKAKHLTCLIDCSHSIDRFVGNVCSNKPKITIKGEDPLDWDVSYFHDTAVDVWYVIKAIYAQERPLYLYREIVKRSNGKYNEMRKFCVTRYCSQVFMMVRYKKNYPVLQELLSSVAFKDWLGKQSKQIKVRFERVARIVNAQDHQERVDTFIQVLGKAAELVRLCDGMKGVYLGTLYEAVLSYENSIGDDLKEIKGLDDEQRTRLHSLFCIRWKYFHKDVCTAAFMLHPAYLREEFDDEQEKELKRYFKQVATTYDGYDPGFTYLDLKGEYTSFMNDVTAQRDDFTEDVAFSTKALDKAPYEWWQMFGDDYPALKKVGIKLGACQIGSSKAETDWSIRKWMTAGRYAARGVKLVNAMSRLYHNLVLENVLAQLETDAPCVWDVDCAIPDPPKETPRATEGEATADVQRGQDEEEDDDDLFGDPAKDFDAYESDEEPVAAPPGRAREEEEEQVEQEEGRPRRRVRPRHG